MVCKLNQFFALSFGFDLGEADMVFQERKYRRWDLFVLWLVVIRSDKGMRPVPQPSVPQLAPSP